MGGAVAAIEQGYMKRRLVESNAQRVAAIESGAHKVVGVNAFTESAPSPLRHAADGGFLTIDPDAERIQIERIRAWRENRDAAPATAALEGLVRAASEKRNIMEPSIACAHAGVTTGEWRARSVQSSVNTGPRQELAARPHRRPTRLPSSAAHRWSRSPAWPPTEDSCWQAGIGWAFERRRANRRPRPRCRLRGGL